MMERYNNLPMSVGMLQQEAFRWLTRPHRPRDMGPEAGDPEAACRAGVSIRGL
jgi:hypothetical protein